MRFIQETGFRVRQGRTSAFQEWVAANEARFKHAYPEGTELLGIYVVVFGSEKGTGEARILEALDSYGALDRLAALSRDPDGEMSKVGREFDAFIDPDPDAPGCQFLLKHIVHATVWDLPAEEEADRTHAEAVGSPKP